MVEAELIIAGIQGLIRAGKAANEALVQYEIEDDVFIPELLQASRSSSVRESLLSWR